MNLYPRRTLRASCGILLIGIIGLSLLTAQRKSQHKLRATALVELTTDARGNKTVRVVPITILDQGNFHDASIYKAAPEPLALGSGVVYEASKTGVPVGFATVSSAAVHNGTWTAEGKWQPETDKPKPKATVTPVTNPADERPRLRRGGRADATPSSEPSSSPQSGSSDDRPVLHKKPDEGSASTTPSPQASASPSSSPESGSSDDRPVLHKKSEEPATSATPAAEANASPSPAAAPAVTPEEDPNRPTLRRGKPVPTPEKAASTTNSTPNPVSAKSSKAASTSSPGTQTFVAVSDAAPDDARSFQFMWKQGEEAPIDAKLKQLAAERLAKNEGKTGSAAMEQALKNVVIRSFDLDLSNDAVLVLTAELPPVGSSGAVKPVAKGQAAPKEASANPPATKYVTLITRVDLDGNPQVLASSVTDSSRLDIAPRLELVDAVDVDGDGIGELLFREYDFDQATFVVYAVRHGTLTKLFEGASQSLK